MKVKNNIIMNVCSAADVLFGTYPSKWHIIIIWTLFSQNDKYDAKIIISINSVNLYCNW